MKPSAAADEHGTSSVRRRGTRKVVGVGCLVFLVMAGILGYAVFLRPGATLPPLPEPNGYDDFVAAGRMISQEPDDVNVADEATLATFVDENQAALERGRLGLTRECRVPIEFTRQHITDSIDRISQVRKFARLLSAEGRLAALRGRTTQASESFLDLVRLGHAARQGALMVDYLVGCACDSMGFTGLRSLVPELPAAECRQLVDQLKTIESRAEPIAVVLEREDLFADEAFGLSGKYVRFMNPQLSAGPRSQAEQAAQRDTARLHLLLGHLALRMYHESHGDYPEGLDALTPEFLEAAPLDSFTGKPLVYRRDDGGYRLYSLGPDGKDDDGAPLSTAQSASSPVAGDVVLEIESPSETKGAEPGSGAAAPQP